MAQVKVKRIKEKINTIKNAWNEGAPDVEEFRNTKKTTFASDITAAQAVEDEIADLKAQLKMKEDDRDDRYAKLEDDAIDIAEGVRGHKDYGRDSALYGAMGFVRQSEKKSGLTHKKKSADNKDGGVK